MYNKNTKEEKYMNIGIDIDGVLLDSERWYACYGDYLAYFDFHKEKIRKDTVMIEQNYDLTQAEIDKFYDLYFDKVTCECTFMPLAKEILQKLKDDGHKLYVITMRGYYNDNEVKYAKKRLKNFGVDFDGCEWICSDKSIMCNKLNIDFMIEDNPTHIKKIVKKAKNTKCIQFFAEHVKPLKHENVIFADNWVDVYKIIKANQK